MMHRLIGLLLILLLTGKIFAQKIDQKDVPAVIVNSFQVKFPTAENVHWRLNKENYRVNFDVNNKEHEVILDKRGRFVKQKQDLYLSEIPKVVLQTIRKIVPLFDIEDADKITENGITTYDINFEIDNKDHFFRIDEKGRLLKYNKDLKFSKIPEPIWSYIKTYGKLDVEHAQRTEENGKVVFWVDGDINHKEHDLYFTEKGLFIKHIQELKNEEIPPGILFILKSKYKDYEIRDAIMNKDSITILYDIQMRKSKEKITLTFNQNGELIGSEKEP
jgi:hypothetical protein